MYCCGLRVIACPPDEPLCHDCEIATPRYSTLTKTTALREYRLRPTDLDGIACVEKRNPHWKTGPHDLVLMREEPRGLGVGAKESRSMSPFP
jgi:hypothetical protein